MTANYKTSATIVFKICQNNPFTCFSIPS